MLLRNRNNSQMFSATFYFSLVKVYLWNVLFVWRVLEQKVCARCFETKMLIYQSKANLDGKIFFGNITHLMDPKIRKMLEKGLLGHKDSISHSGP